MFSSFELSIFFLIKYKKQQVQLKNSQDLGFFAMFLGFSTMWFFFIIGDYYSVDIIESPFYIWRSGSYRTVLLNCGYVSVISGALLFMFFNEKNRKFLFKRYFFTICYLIFLVIFIITFFINLQITTTLSIFFWPSFVLFFLIYIIEFVRKVKAQENPLLGMVKFLLPWVILLVGYILSMDDIIDNFGLEFRLLGAIMQLTSIGLIFNFFRRLPPFFEFDWQNKIESIYIMNKGGACLYHMSFTEKSASIDEDLITGAIASINIMLEEIIRGKKKGFSMIKKKGKIINIFSSEHITGVIFSTEELRFFNYNLRELIVKVEQIYHNVLINWSDDIEIFHPISNIIDELFSW